MYNAGISAADGRVNTSSASYSAGANNAFTNFNVYCNIGVLDGYGFWSTVKTFGKYSKISIKVDMNFFSKSGTIYVIYNGVNHAWAASNGETKEFDISGADTVSITAVIKEGIGYSNVVAGCDCWYYR